LLPICTVATTVNHDISIAEEFLSANTDVRASHMSDNRQAIIHALLLLNFNLSIECFSFFNAAGAVY
jgi:hypothetical protein